MCMFKIQIGSCICNVNDLSSVGCDWISKNWMPGSGSLTGLLLELAVGLAPSSFHISWNLIPTTWICRHQHKISNGFKTQHGIEHHSMESMPLIACKEEWQHKIMLPLLLLRLRTKCTKNGNADIEIYIDIWINNYHNNHIHFIFRNKMEHWISTT